MDAARVLGLDHIRFMSADHHGIDRGKTVPIAAAEQFLQSGLTSPLITYGLGPRCEIVPFPEVR